MITYQVRLVFKVLHTCQEKSPQNPTTKTATSSQDLTSIPKGYRKMKILPVFVKVKTKWNFTNINQGYRFSAFSQQDENTNIMHQGNSFSASPHKRKYQYYAPREQLLSSFPTRDNINIMHQGNSFSDFSQQKQVILITTRHFIDHVGVTN